MVRKLLRHEFRATQRIILPFYLLLFVTAVMFNISMGLMEKSDAAVQWPLQVFFGVSTTSFVVSLIGVTVLCGVLMVYRFYKNLMTDEGYLMFTLPVTVPQIIASKLIVTLVWNIVTLLADALAALLAFCRTFTVEEIRFAWHEVQEVLSQVSTGNIIGYAVELVVLLLFSTLASYLTYYAAIALGHSFANHKILLSVAFYFAFAIAMRVVGSIFTTVAMTAAMAVDWEEFNPFALSHWGLGIAAAIAMVQAVVFYILTHLMLRKRLNLQ